MRDIVNALKKKLRHLTDEIDSLEAQRKAIRRALAAVDGTPVRSRRAASTHRVARATPRGRNQERVLRTLTAAPQRLSAIATKTRLSMSNAGGVLRTLIGKGLVAKAARRGSYVLKKRSASSTVTKPS